LAQVLLEMAATLALHPQHSSFLLLRVLSTTMATSLSPTQATTVCAISSMAM